MNERTLIYATGGVAVADVRFNTAYSTVLAAGVFPQGTPLSASDSKVQVGWTAGIGGEWAMDRDWTFGAEYRHVDLGSRTVNTGFVDTFTAAFFAPNVASVRYTVDQVTVRASWHPWH